MKYKKKIDKANDEEYLAKSEASQKRIAARLGAPKGAKPGYQRQHIRRKLG